MVVIDFDKLDDFNKVCDKCDNNQQCDRSEIQRVFCYKMIQAVSKERRGASNRESDNK